jgi:predicted nucleotidyltransferase
MNTTVDDARLPLPVQEIAALCRQFGVERLEVFGSSLRDDFRPDSDVDFLVVFRDACPGLTDFQDLQDELARLIGRKVDLLSRKAVERSSNYLMRRSILSTARPIYEHR